eukprot:2628004-Prymnesium_polylepis.1
MFVRQCAPRWVDFPHTLRLSVPISAAAGKRSVQLTMRLLNATRWPQLLDGRTLRRVRYDSRLDSEAGNGGALRVAEFPPPAQRSGGCIVHAVGRKSEE